MHPTQHLQSHCHVQPAARASVSLSMTLQEHRARVRLQNLSQFRTFPRIVPPSRKTATNQFFTHWQRGTIFAATYCRIHDNPKPVQNIPLHSPAKPQGSDIGREEPFLQPHIAESTTIPSQFRTFPCIGPPSHKAAIFSPTGREEPFLQPHIAESTTSPSQFRTFPCIGPPSHKAAMNHFCIHLQRGTIFAATCCRIHDNPKSVQNIPLHSPAKPQGSDAPFFHPLAERNHFCSHILQNPRQSQASSEHSLA